MKARVYNRLFRGSLGFKKEGRVFVNPSTSISVEFPSAPLAVGNELIKKTTVAQTTTGSIPILYIEDVIKDRLAAFIHWRDQQSLIQAVMLMLKNNLKPTKFKHFCITEGDVDHYTLTNQLWKAASSESVEGMQELESLLMNLLIRNI